MELKVNLTECENDFEFKSILSKGKISYINEKDILKIIKPEIKRSSTAKKRKNINYSATDVRPIEIGVLKKTFLVNGTNIRNKYVILNGESILKERVDAGYRKIKAHIKEFNSWEEMQKRALSFDIRETYTKEEINIKIKAIIKNKVKENEKINKEKLSSETGVSRSVISKLIGFYEVEKIIKADEESLIALNMISEWCYRILQILSNQGNEVITTFFKKNTKKIIKDGGITRANYKKYELIVKNMTSEKNLKELMLKETIKNFKTNIKIIEHDLKEEIKKELEKILETMNEKTENIESIGELKTC